MRKIVLYGGTFLVASVLIYLGERWFGAEWLFGLLAIGLFALFLQGWKRWGSNGAGLVVVTAFLLFALDSIFFVQDIPIFICSLVLGFLLTPHFQKHRDSVAASLLFVLLNMLISLEFVPNELMWWLIVFVTGAASVIGFGYNFTLVKVCFTALFSAAAFLLLFFQLFDDSYFLIVLAIVAIAFFIACMVRLNGKVAA